MKYESNILKRLIDTYGVVGNPCYLSEIIKEFIVQGKECYPNLFTYQADWLAHIDEFGLTPDYVVSYTGQQIYAPHTKESPVKRAILKGSTKYRDIDTGEILETFEEGRNLELVSVRMPVLTTSGKNIMPINSFTPVKYSGAFINHKVCDLKLKPNTNYTFSNKFYVTSNMVKLVIFDSSDTQMVVLTGNTYTTFTTNSNEDYWVCIYNHDGAGKIIEDIMLKEGAEYIEYEPYKSNILTVNEDVTLRSNGDICDELNLLTGQLTQRIGEDGVVLSQEVVKTVDLTVKDQNNFEVSQLSSFNGGTHFTTSSQDGSLLPTLTVDVVTDLEEVLMVCSLEGNTM